MFNHMFESNQLKAEMEKYELEMDRDLIFIKEMIVGPLETDTDDVQEESWPYKGREKDKSFLYEIVSNKTNGIDVDKFDYLARDCYYLGFKNSFDHRRVLKFARVCKVEGLGSKHISYRDKTVDDMYDLFDSRYRLHRRVCFHRVTNIIQIMIRDAFLMADGHFKIKGSGGQKFTLSTAINDMEAYTKLTDNVFETILHSSNPNLRRAKEILQRIVSRDLYKLWGQKRRGQTRNETLAVVAQWTDERTRELHDLEPGDFEVVPINLDYGLEEDNPLNSIYFYSKEDRDNASIVPEEERPKLVTNDFSENLIRFYFKGTDEESLQRARDHFQRWMEEFVEPEPNPAENEPEVLEGGN